MVARLRAFPSVVVLTLPHSGEMTTLSSGHKANAASRYTCHSGGGSESLVVIVVEVVVLIESFVAA